jgi:gluconolactonase
VPTPLPASAAPGVAFTPSTRYPDPAIEVLHESFARLRVYSTGVEQLATGFRWAEGPVWFGDLRCLLFSDVPGNTIYRWDACSGATSVFRSPSQHANGHARDRMGRLVSCEHHTRRITRTEHDGTITVLADRWQGRRLNSPNDIVCARDGSLWFTDPSFGIDSDWEGDRAPSETPHAVYRWSEGGELQRVIDDLSAPNGLAFSPDQRVLYVVESRAEPWRRLWAYDVGADGALANKRLFAEADDGGAYDGIAVDVEGNVWCGYGSNGRAGVASAGLDGVRVLDAGGRAIGHVHLPERCANVCFGGEKGNRLFMAASHSLYALFLNTRGA